VARTTGSITTYTGLGIALPVGITPGSDKAMWFTSRASGEIGRIITSGSVITYAGAGGDAGIAAGPDGALWFGER
jgi:virginiamycin B lyase